MDTFDIPIPMQIITTSLHDITHHDLFSPHRHTPIFFTYGTTSHNKKEMRSLNDIHDIHNIYYSHEKLKDERSLELFMVTSQSWS